MSGSRFEYVSALTTMALLSACANLPPKSALTAPRAADSFASAQSFAAPDGPTPAIEWWRDARDPALDALMAEGLAGSPDVAAAMARVQKAQAFAAETGGDLLPRVTLDGSGGVQKQSENNGIPANFVPKGIQDTGRIAGGLNFDLDLWGRNRAALAAATSDAKAAAVDAAQARLMLTTEIASAYIDLAVGFVRQDLNHAAVQSRETTMTLTSARYAQGLENRGNVNAAEARAASARGDEAAAAETITLIRYRLAALVGAGPDRGFSIGRPVGLVPTHDGIPATLALDLVGRRPDIVAARLRTEAAAARIKVARAEFYPNINLSAVIGLQSLGLGELFRGTSSIGSAGPAISLPLFDGGRLRGRYRGAEAEYSEAVAHYDAALVGALHEVADALASKRALIARMTQAQVALNKAQMAQDAVRARYKGGLATLLDVLTTDDAVLGARAQVAEMTARGAMLNVALIRALGGGFTDSTSTGTEK